jgi:hypothetical protein
MLVTAYTASGCRKPEDHNMQYVYKFHGILMKGMNTNALNTPPEVTHVIKSMTDVRCTHVAYELAKYNK